MRIFYYWPEHNTIMGHWQRVHFIDELSRHGVQVYTFNPLLYDTWEEANEQAIKEIKADNYDAFFTVMCQKEVLFVETLIEIKKMGIPTVCLRCDNLVLPYIDKFLSPYFDLLWLTSIDTKRFYDKWGVKTCFAPYAANPYTFKYEERVINRRACFVGTPYGSRARMFNTLLRGGADLTVFFGNSTKETKNNKESSFETKIEIPPLSFLSVLTSRLRFKEGRTLLKGTIKNKLFGNCVVDESSHLQIKPSVATLELSRIYSEYVISLASTSAVHTDVLKNPLKIINLRNFEIPMSGGIEICRYNRELAEYYEEDKEILFYRCDEELVEKARYFIEKASDNEIFNIKRAARIRSVNEHTWYHRFKKVFREIDIII